MYPSNHGPYKKLSGPETIDIILKKLPRYSRKNLYPWAWIAFIKHGDLSIRKNGKKLISTVCLTLLSAAHLSYLDAALFFWP